MSLVIGSLLDWDNDIIRKIVTVVEGRIAGFRISKMAYDIRRWSGKPNLIER